MKMGPPFRWVGLSCGVHVPGARQLVASGFCTGGMGGSLQLRVDQVTGWLKERSEAIYGLLTTHGVPLLLKTESRHFRDGPVRCCFGNVAASFCPARCCI